MDPSTAYMAGAGLSAIAGVGGASIANQGSKDAMVKSIDYDYMMRNIGPWLQQRALKTAGLNPILAVNPTAMQNAAFPPTYHGAQPNFMDPSSALDAFSKADERNMNITKMSHELNQIIANTQLTETQKQKVGAEIDKIVTETNLNKLQERINTVTFQSEEEGLKWLAQQPELQMIRQAMNSVGIEGRDITNMIGDIVKVIFGRLKGALEGYTEVIRNGAKTITKHRRYDYKE